MPSPQAGILEEPRPFSTFSVWHLRDLQGGTRPVLKALKALQVHVQKVQEQNPQSALTATLGLGANLWAELSPTRRPHGLHPFVAMEKEGRSMPYTGGDVLLHLNCIEPGINFEAAQPAYQALAPLAEVETTHGFRYKDSRDLTGFIDGTANPKGDERGEAALIGGEDALFAGGSYVITQRWVHDLDRWQKLSAVDQEYVIGRTKPDSEELPEDRKPETAHISRVEVEVQGHELKIVRHSMPYAQEGGEAGLFFIAYARDVTIFHKMLARMVGATDDGLYDHLMDYTRPVTGAYFFAPSRETLQSL